MNIRILQLIEGAKAARGLTVIIDVFRAFSVEAYLLANGAKKIIPIANVEEAYRLKSENPDYILAGERHGAILPGFDLGNSPSVNNKSDVVGKNVVHTTSAGTQGVDNARGATEILGGSLLNAAATAEYIRKSGADEVSLVCMGLEALEPTDEDTLCAEYIKSLLEGKSIDLATKIERLKSTSGAKFFDPAQQDVFPKDDFYACTEVDKFDFVLRLVRPEGDIPYMEKIKVL